MSNLPFEKSYWVIPQKLIAGEIPVSENSEERQKKLKGLISANVKAVINLMEPDARNHQGNLFYDYSSDLANHSIDTYRFPIVDMNVPLIGQMVEILDCIDLCIESGKMVYIHCWGGIGRTGTVLGCYLIRKKLATKENVLKIIEELKSHSGLKHRQSPETREQENFVLHWLPDQ